MRFEKRHLIIAVCLLSMNGGACMLVDPPADIPVQPIQNVKIQGAQSFPSTADLLETCPATFTVPVTVDPREDGLDWSLVADAPPPLLTELQSIGSNSQVVLSFRCPFMGTNLLTCHTIILYVSYDDGTGSDEAAWFYSPTGSFEDCISLQADAGVGDGGSTSQDD